MRWITGILAVGRVNFFYVRRIWPCIIVMRIFPSIIIVLNLLHTLWKTIMGRKQLDLTMSRDQIALAVDAIMNKRANIQVSCGKRGLICDRGRAFFIHSHLNEVEGVQPLILGEQSFGDWKIMVTEVDDSEKLEIKNSWRDVWGGE